MPIQSTNLSNIVSEGVKAPDIAENLSEGLKTGIQLATAADTIEAQKAKVAEMKLDLQNKQFQSTSSMLKNLAMANPKVGKLMAPRIKENMIKLGFDPNIVDYITSDDASRARFVNVANMLQGKIKTAAQLSEALQAFSDIGEFDKGITSFEAALKGNRQNEQFYAELKNRKDIAMLGLLGKEQRQTAQEEKDYKQALRLDKNKLEEIIRKDRDALRGFEDASKLLEGGGIPQAAGQRALAKAFNAGALTDADVEELSGNKALAARFRQLVQTAADGKLTEQNYNELKEIVDLVKPALARRIKTTVDDSVDRFHANYGGDKAQIYASLAPQHLLKSLQPAAGGGKAPDAALAAKIAKAKAAGYTDAEIQAYLKQGK